MSRPPAGPGNGSQAFMWVSLLVMTAAFVLIALEQRHPAPPTETLDRATSVETVATPAPEPAPPPPDHGVPRNM